VVNAFMGGLDGCRLLAYSPLAVVSRHQAARPLHLRRMLCTLPTGRVHCTRTSCILRRACVNQLQRSCTQASQGAAPSDLAKLAHAMQPRPQPPTAAASNSRRSMHIQAHSTWIFSLSGAAACTAAVAVGPAPAGSGSPALPLLLLLLLLLPLPLPPLLLPLPLLGDLPSTSRSRSATGMDSLPSEDATSSLQPATHQGGECMRGSVTCVRLHHCANALQLLTAAMAGTLPSPVSPTPPLSPSPCPRPPPSPHPPTQTQTLTAAPPV
jgi:hypothetical protein